ASTTMVYPMPSWTLQKCEMTYGSANCRCSQEGCLPCKRSDYTYTVSSCDNLAMRSVRFHVEPFICDLESGVNLPSSFQIACDHLPIESAQSYSITVLTSVGGVLALACVHAVHYHRRNKYVVAAQPMFLQLFLLGTIIVLGGNTMPLGNITKVKCQALSW